MIIIHPDGKVEERKYNGDINEIYEAIHAGLFDIVHVGNGIDLFVDDEGLFREENFKNGRPRWNAKASHLRMMGLIAMEDRINWEMAGGLPPLCGWCCALANDGNGNTIDLNDEQVRYIKDALNIK